MTAWIDFSKRENATMSRAEYFISQYSGILVFDD